MRVLSKSVTYRTEVRPELEREARGAERGLWGDMGGACFFRPADFSSGSLASSWARGMPCGPPFPTTLKPCFSHKGRSPFHMF